MEIVPASTCPFASAAGTDIDTRTGSPAAADELKEAAGRVRLVVYEMEPAIGVDEMAVALVAGT